jgi:cell division protein FtsB
MVKQYKDVQEAVSAHGASLAELNRAVSEFLADVEKNEKFVASLDWKVDRVTQLNAEIKKLQEEEVQAKAAKTQAVEEYAKFKAGLK